MYRYRNFLPLFLFSPEGDAGSGAATPPVAPLTGTPNPNDAPEGDEPEPEPISKNAGIEELRADNARQSLRISELIGEKRKLSTKVRTLATDATALAAYQALGTPEEIAARLDAGKVAIEAEGKRSKTKSRDEAAAVAGINAETLASLAGANDVDYIVSGEGDARKAIVKFKEGDKEVEKDLAEWAKAKWPKFVASLFDTAEGEAETPNDTPANASNKTLTPIHRGAPANSGTGKTSVYDKIRERNQKAAEAQAKNGSLLDKAREAGMVK